MGKEEEGWGQGMYGAWGRRRCGMGKMDVGVDKHTLGIQFVNGKYANENSGKWYFENR